MLGTTVLIPSSLVPQMGGGNVSLQLLWIFEGFSCFLMNIVCGSQFSYYKISFQAEKAKMIQTLLFVAGLNTLLQTFFGTRLPAVIGGSYSYVPTTISIILAGRYSDIVNPQEVTFVC